MRANKACAGRGGFCGFFKHFSLACRPPVPAVPAQAEQAGFEFFCSQIESTPAPAPVSRKEQARLTQTVGLGAWEGKNMEFDELIRRALSIRKLIRQYEEQNYGTSWTNEEMALGFVGDVGDLAKLVMAQNGRRAIPEAERKLAHELADCLWSIIVLADGHGVDLEKAFLKTMDDLENYFQKGPVAG